MNVEKQYLQWQITYNLPNVNEEFECLVQIKWFKILFCKDLAHIMDFCGIFDIINKKINIKFEILKNRFIF